MLGAVEVFVPGGDILWTLLMVVGTVLPIVTLVLLVTLVVTARKILSVINQNDGAGARGAPTNAAHNE